MSLTTLNNATAEQASVMLESCCVAPNWVSAMVAKRPFDSAQQLFNAADAVWCELGETDYLAAFEGHPQIGDVSTLREKYAATADKAGHEQSGMQVATDEMLQEMMRLNKAYLDKFGFIFIVCATGKSANEMLGLIRARVCNDRATELAIAAGEQAKITRIRLEKLL
ncbi:2-oxo-4-hydroxy-4-carboxy-5-ureidoimidazoline decarboxylase [Alteromonas sp. ASW11-36]|uniref:2-oxo-4-hydroxy-4-carboxy-5-ureidoimidazoline decarboxylase n=1 Tax=Alteromonas arenosi TaxID=3055817 RepID=A0ABT7SYS1_9ALTE|nr:2-oxo-4-hydroxy-4-carboxy-5-ureidoimidazoline decarboxylase [Alteromonas sp. ASW11-36]MDM7861343.1 2-oxo-4-hydroxy-4-carboxy-5-ureidoimidazoline decarboxylase [Alteromonas sp. ASW11-36]